MRSIPVSRSVLVGVSCGGAWLTEDDGATWECRATGMFADYMPQDRRFADEELTKLEKFLGGMADLNGIPDNTDTTPLANNAVASPDGAGLVETTLGESVAPVLKVHV
mgnify:CR=1 FL=1